MRTLSHPLKRSDYDTTLDYAAAVRQWRLEHQQEQACSNDIYARKELDDTKAMEHFEQSAMEFYNGE